MKRLAVPSRWPDVWMLLEASLSPSEAARLLGPPHGHECDPSLVPGPLDWWALGTECGLQLHVEAHPVRGGFCVVTGNLPEPGHAAAHLGLPPECITWRGQRQRMVPASVPPGRPPEDWEVWRTDDHGGRFLVEVLATEATARCYAGALEARAHKQSYFVEERRG